MKQLVLPLLCVVAWFASPAGAAPVEYTIDPARSVLKLSGTFAGAPLVAQAPGTDAVGYFREMNGDLDEAAGTLALHTSHAVSLAQKVQVLPGREEGDTTGAYGLKAQSNTLGQVLVSTTPLSFYFSTEYGEPIDVSDGTFQPADAGFFLADGALYYSLEGGARQYVDLHGYGAPNRASSAGTLIREGTRETLTIPVATTFTVVSPAGDVTLSFTGQIVATRVIASAVLKSEARNDLFGLSVATNTGTIMVGAPFGDATRGEVHVYYQTGDGFDQWKKHQVLRPALPVLAGPKMFGTAISLNQNTAAIATYHSPVFIFERTQPGYDWAQTAIIETPDDTEVHGDSISLSEGLLAIGVNTFGDSEQGCVLLYRRDEATRAWHFVTRLQADDPQEQAFFGSSVALGGDYLVVGAPGVADDSGAVYAFYREAGTWRQIQKILPPNPIKGGLFGNSVATNLGQIVIAEPGDGYTADTYGKVYLYETTTLAQPYHWEVKQGLVPAEGLPEKSRFGHRVAIDGSNRDIVVTQLKVASTPETQPPGSAYVFSLHPEGWRQRLKFAPPQAEPGSSFGISLANATVRTVVGDYGSSARPGAVYIYDLTPAPAAPYFVNAPADLQVDAADGESVEVPLEVTVVDEDGSDLFIRWYVDGIEERREFVDGGVPFTTGTFSFTPLLTPGVHHLRVVADERSYDGEAAHTFTVTVGDTDDGPTIESITATPSSIPAQGRRMVLVRLNVEVTATTEPVTWRITAVESSDDGPRRPRQVPDWIITPNKHAVRLRATTDKRKGDRIYSIHVEARDALGNTTNGQTTVRIVAERNQPHGR